MGLYGVFKLFGWEGSVDIVLGPIVQGCNIGSGP